MARILMVDDDEEARLFQASVLESAGHQIFFATNGEEAMRAFLRRGVDLVVTDLQMPSGDGFELIDALQGLGSEVPIIAVSGTGPGMLDTAKLIGAFSTLPKPVDPERLLAAVRDALVEGRSRG